MSEVHARVGRVKDAHGIKGEIYITLFAGEAAWLDKLKDVRLVSEADDGQAVDGQAAKNELKLLTVKSARIHKNGLIIKSNEITDRNAAEALKGHFLEIPQDFLKSELGESLYLSEVKGFRVFTQHKGEVGIIIGFSSNGFQDLLVVKTAWGDFEIPFVEDFVERIDYENQEMYLVVPEGLLGEFDQEETEESDGSHAGDDAGSKHKPGANLGSDSDADSDSDDEEAL
jgi:16S rRNA processing protein RimM